MTKATKPAKPASAPGAATETPVQPNMPPVAPAVAATRATRADRLVDPLSQPGGVSMIEITRAMGVQAHSARAQISTLRKGHGLTIELVDARYRIVPIEPAGREALDPALGN